MNKERRKIINSIVEKLREINSEIEKVISEEKEYYDNMPDGFYEKKTNQSIFTINDFESAKLSILNAIDSLEEAAE